MSRWRKKSIVVEAERLTKHKLIRTLEGFMTGKPGDFLVTGVKGEKYPVRPDIFLATYEPLPDDLTVTTDPVQVIKGCVPPGDRQP